MKDINKQEFERLMAQDPDGLLRPEAVIRTAEDPNHPWHGWFTWNDDEAAHKWRLEQAGMLIRSYKINMEPMNIKVQALTSLATDRHAGGGYRWVSDVMARPDLKAQMLATALADLQRLETKYAHLEELAEVWDVAHTVAPQKAKVKV